jgi:DNA mismatch repair ATPase MutS
MGVTENLGGKSTLCREIALVSLAAKVAAVPGER